VLSSLLAAVLLYFSVRGVDWGRVWRTIAAAQWRYLAATAALTTFSFFVRAIRWRILLNTETWFSVGTVFWANMAGYLGNNFLPARAGELIRTYLISNRSSLSKTYVLTTALGERLMDVIALVLWSSLVLLGLDPKPRWMQDLSRTMAIVAGAGAVAIMLLPHTGGLVENLLRRTPLPEGLRNRLLRLAEQILLGLRAFHNWGRFTGFVLLTVVIWTADSVGVMAGCRALGLTLSFRVALLLVTALGLGSALPSTPGYVGIYQFVSVTVLAPFGISRDEALAYILVAQALASVLLLAFGLPGLYKLQGSKPGGETKV
jgi:uncharacterized protein (TIRG00374 family)